MAMKNPEVFEGKNFQELLKDIYDNTSAKKTQIKTLMDTLANMLKAPGSKPADAAVIAPLVKDFLEVAVKNDEHLVKMATIIQRLMSAETISRGTSLTDILTEEEKSELLKEAEKEAFDELENEVEEAVKENVEIENLKERAKKTIDTLKDDK